MWHILYEGLLERMNSLNLGPLLAKADLHQMYLHT